MTSQTVALVTGASSGIGHAIAQLLAERGLRVFGTSRAPAGKLLRLDVTDQASVDAAVAEILRLAGRLDLLVNNAGFALAGAIEETSLEEARAQFETNFFGVLRLVQAVLPIMRRQGRGRIVNIGSVAGLLPLPYRGLYAASKHALAGYTETLDHEVRGFGIRAVLVEPSFTRTRLEAGSRNSEVRLAAYAPQRARVTEAILAQVARGDDPRRIAEVVYRAASDQPPRLHYPAGAGVRLSRLRRLVPAGLFDRRLRRRFALDEPPGRRP